ncbi:TIR domain-containing protein [Mesorhizobium sp. GbtcB19]|uniref:TIR domain-containing protein n=1 Tax=Mesorhizobium sp. GbtcB19 TaxID=2824764 RepID=UPI001C30ED86|nr:nucleotide-binding protein [Mesorhizobium sp. GbtcB19]
MNVSPKIIVNAARRENLSPDQSAFLEALSRKISDCGYSPLDVDGVASLTDQVAAIRRIQGVVVVAFAQWSASRIFVRRKSSATLPSEFNHLYIALASALQKPLLVLREQGVTERGALRPTMGRPALKIPSEMDRDWLDSEEFEAEFRRWRRQIDSSCHVFFGYAGVASDTANQLISWMTKKNIKVLDWKDFNPSSSIFSGIASAAKEVSFGLFLLTADDVKKSKNKEIFTPRDNVVFEAGYFAAAKGLDRTLLIVEDGISLPSDLGGIIYLRLDGRKNVSSIEGRLADFLETALQPPDGCQPRVPNPGRH